MVYCQWKIRSADTPSEFLSVFFFLVLPIPVFVQVTHK